MVAVPGCVYSVRQDSDSFGHLRFVCVGVQLHALSHDGTARCSKSVSVAQLCATWSRSVLAVITTV